MIHLFNCRSNKTAVEILDSLVLMQPVRLLGVIRLSENFVHDVVACFLVHDVMALNK